jgi:prepilin-type processing-associated H-X9-DG protein
MADRLPRHLGLTLLETVISLLLIAALFGILLPTLSTARSTSFRERCAMNQVRIGQAWEQYLQEHNDRFPSIAVSPGWRYGGVRFTQVGNVAFPDETRPLTPYLPCPRTADKHEVVWCCPADYGISDPAFGTGTGGRSAYRSFGTSFRANPAFLDWRPVDGEGGLLVEGRGLHRSEITAAPSRLLLLGDAFWHEAAERTGRQADWHQEPGKGNLLFFDGSVRFRAVWPRLIPGPITFDPMSGVKLPADPEQDFPAAQD